MEIRQFCKVFGGFRPNRASVHLARGKKTKNVFGAIFSLRGERFALANPPTASPGPPWVQGGPAFNTDPPAPAEAEQAPAEEPSATAESPAEEQLAERAVAASSTAECPSKDADALAKAETDFAGTDDEHAAATKLQAIQRGKQGRTEVARQNILLHVNIIAPIVETII